MSGLFLLSCQRNGEDPPGSRFVRMYRLFLFLLCLGGCACAGQNTGVSVGVGRHGPGVAVYADSWFLSPYYAGVNVAFPPFGDDGWERSGATPQGLPSPSPFPGGAPAPVPPFGASSPAPASPELSAGPGYPASSGHEKTTPATRPADKDSASGSGSLPGSPGLGEPPPSLSRTPSALGRTPAALEPPVLEKPAQE